MKIGKILARNFLFPGLIKLGIEKTFLRTSGRNCMIVNFHGVTNIKGNRFNNRHLDSVEFEKILIYFKENFALVSLKEIFEIHRSKKKPAQKTLALTFDDGYVNNFTQALPLLKKYNVPATFYLISEGLINEEYYVWPDIIDLVQKNVKEDIKLDAGTFKYPGFFCEVLNKSLVDYLKSCGSKRENYINELATKYPYYKAVAKEHPQLIELIRQNNFMPYISEPLIEYGSHTNLHYNLEFLTRPECEHELFSSKNIIEQMIGKKVVSIAFPDGSYNTETLDACNKAGYQNQVAVEYKFNEQNRKDFLLSRFTISNSTTFESNMVRLSMQFKKYGF